jgi:phage baseplate assembly protein W
LVRWEPRIEVISVNAEPDQAAQGAVRIEVAYRVKVTNDRRNLVYPFYVIPGEGSTIEEEPS